MKKRKVKKEKNFKKKRTFKKFFGIIATVLLCTLLVSVVGFATSGFTNGDPQTWFQKERNPDNLIDVKNYLLEDGRDDGKGIKVKVDDDGVIKLNGKATSENNFRVAEVVLEPGTYTISGIKSCDGYALEVIGANNLHAKAGISGATFTIEQTETVTVNIYVAEGTRLVNKTFQPCLVEGDVAGEMLK